MFNLYTLVCNLAPGDHVFSMKFLCLFFQQDWVGGGSTMGSRSDKTACCIWQMRLGGICHPYCMQYGAANVRGHVGFTCFGPNSDKCPDRWGPLALSHAI